MTLVTTILKGTDNSFETTSEMANGPTTDFFNEGVIGDTTNTSGIAPATGAFATNEAGTPDMTVDVSAGTAYVTATPTGQGSQLLRVVSSATESVTINANATGGTRYDWVYLQIDATNAAAPNSTGSNVATLVTQRSTTLATDSNGTPSYSYAIAVVTVANGASSIVDANITDKRTAAGISTDNIVTTDGAWQDYTPAIFSGGTIGNGTVVGRYRQVGKDVYAEVRIVFDITGGDAVNPGFGFSPPVAMHSKYDADYVGIRIGYFNCSDASNSRSYDGAMSVTDSTRIRPIVQNITVDPTYAESGPVSTGVPMTWANDDYMSFTLHYEAA